MLTFLIKEILNIVPVESQEIVGKLDKQKLEGVDMTGCKYNVDK